MKRFISVWSRWFYKDRIMIGLFDWSGSLNCLKNWCRRKCDITVRSDGLCGFDCIGMFLSAILSELLCKLSRRGLELFGELEARKCKVTMCWIARWLDFNGRLSKVRVSWKKHIEKDALEWTIQVDSSSTWAHSLCYYTQKVLHDFNLELVTLCSLWSEASRHRKLFEISNCACKVVLDTNDHRSFSSFWVVV